jgi:hypothetical protein
MNTFAATPPRIGPDA